MAIKIDRDAMGRYQISLGTGRKVRAISLDEVDMVVRHYYGDRSHDSSICPACITNARVK